RPPLAVEATVAERLAEVRPMLNGVRRKVSDHRYAPLPSFLGARTFPFRLQALCRSLTTSATFAFPCPYIVYAIPFVFLPFSFIFCLFRFFRERGERFFQKMLIAANRNRNAPGNRNQNDGFRVACRLHFRDRLTANPEPDDPRISRAWCRKS